MTLKECTDKYGALNMEEIIEEIQKDLERGGLLKEFRTSRRRKLLFYISKDTVFAVAPLPDKVKNGWTVMDRDIYDENFADGRGSLSFVQRNDRHYRVVAHLKGNGQMPLHRLVMRKRYDDEMLKNSDAVDHEFMSMFINNSYVVDHEFMSTFINTKEALRFATYSQNRQNSRRSHNRNGEFAYNPDVDFTDTWYLYVLHKMLDMGTWKEVQEYNGRIVSAGH